MITIRATSFNISTPNPPSQNTSIQDGDGNIIEITSKEEYRSALANRSKSVLVLDYMAAWCGPRNVSAPSIVKDVD